MAKQTVKTADRAPKKKNKIHVSLFVDGQDVTLLEEFNTPEEAIAAAREFLDKHHPEPATATKTITTTTARQDPGTRRRSR